MVMRDEDKIYNAAVSLPEAARISLIEKLLSSLHLPISAEVDRLWAEEAERRVRQIEGGEVDLIPGEEVFARLRQKYRK
jgi:putative addiction module component (TIGR02574 family)